MNEQTLDNWIANYEASQRQNHAQLLRQIKAEFYQLRDTQRTQRRADLHNHHPAAPPKSLAT
ncbi:MAG: hypothetical protein KME11_12480 [Timaviella obliquedivisa GSE-PSE-MK23-08B]|jgi:hypothetical protein|nr:hypothetical protein [Timaviella obliquedivisa GSE-PSE-MK23-08B]